MITPGTQFMSNLGRWLRHYAYLKLNDPSGQYGKLRIVLSDASVPGEGEHKVGWGGKLEEAIQGGGRWREERGRGKSRNKGVEGGGGRRKEAEGGGGRWRQVEAGGGRCVEAGGGGRRKEVGGGQREGFASRNDAVGRVFR